MSVSTSFAERQFASRYSIAPLDLVVHKSGVPADADANLVTVTMSHLDTGAVVFTRPATRLSVGTYEVTLSSVETSSPGLYQVTWTYGINSVPQTFGGLVEVGESSPAYDALSAGFKGIVEDVYLLFADLFDSPTGGPNLQVYFQTRFGRGRMAQLLKTAIGRLNTVAQPFQTYSLDETQNPFPYSKWGPLLEKALYIETIKHLIRSYTEQPEVQGVATARMDRRDYTERWRAVLTDEAADYAGMLDTFRIANMGLGKTHVLVSGGAFGNIPSPMRTPGQALSRGRWTVGYA